MITTVNKKQFWLNSNPDIWTVLNDAKEDGFRLFVHDVRFETFDKKPLDKFSSCGDAIAVKFDLCFTECAIQDSDELWQTDGGVPMRFFTRMDKDKGHRVVESINDDECGELMLDDDNGSRLGFGHGIWNPKTVIALFKMIDKNKKDIADAVNIALDIDIITVGLKHKQI